MTAHDINIQHLWYCNPGVNYVKPVTRVRIRDALLEVEIETTADIPMDEMITRAEELLGRVKGKPLEDTDKA